MGIFGAAIPSRKAFVCGKPQMNTTRLRMIQGSQARRIADRELRTADCECRSTESPSLLTPDSCLHMVFGFQTFRNPASAASETKDAATSTNHGPCRFETKNCGTANATPATSIAGQISIIPRKPANAQINQNGTINEKNGSWRPTIALSDFRSNPVTPCSPISGAPNAPKATGAVFAISDRLEADSGEKPRPIRIAPVTATGVPKPHAPSMNAPILNATSNNCRRRSS